MSEDVFLELVQQHQAQIYRHALYLLNDQDDASDVTQETLIKAWQNTAELRSETIRSWLLKCANNLCIDLLRRRRFQVPLAKADDEALETLIHYQKENTPFQPSNPSPEDLSVSQERQELVQQAIARLSPNFRAVVIMREIEGMPFEEIAETLNQPVGTVKSNAFRARRKLREILGSLLGR
ncbi:MAG: sigma-70 family RNA polymerase sigma factor [Candidatus Poribacteria bacterium]|nr:sigma-70 family RNA polymerase sigma factor [Candidatus Poribacteria bacterium]